MAEYIRSSHFAPNLKLRFLHQRQTLANMDRVTEQRKYSYSNGSYSGSGDCLIKKLELMSTVERLENAANKTQEGLAGIETWMAGYIEAQMKIKKDYPVIAVDIGGMAGLSWTKLAKHFEKEVIEGKVAFVVTNLVYDPAIHLNSSKLSDDEKKFAKENGHLVHYKVVRPSKYKKLEIILPDGKKVSLLANSDLIYENKSLTAWSNTPDIDILRVASLVSRNGIYMIHSEDAQSAFPDDYARDLAEADERRSAVKIAHQRLLSEYKLTRVEAVEEGRNQGEKLLYEIFKGPQAPSIKA